MKAMKTNLVLAFVLFILGTFYYWYEYQKKPALDKIEETKKKIFTVDQSAELESIQVRYKDKEKSYDIDFECKDNCKMSATNSKWYIVNPIKFAADDANLGSLLSSLSTLSVTESIPIEGDLEKNLEKFGLSKDKRENSRVTVKYKSQTVTLYIGDDTAIDGSVYAYVEAQGLSNDRVRMIPSYVKGYLTRSLSYWRNKKLFNFASSQIERIVLTNPNNSVPIELTKEGTEWFLPYKVPADNEVIDTFTTGIAFMNAKEYVSDSKNKDRTKFKFANKAKYRMQLSVGASKTDTSLAAHKVTLEIYEGSPPSANENATKAGDIQTTPTNLYAVLSDKDFIVELDKPSTDKFAKKLSEFKYKYLLFGKDKENIRKIKASFHKANNFVDMKADDANVWTVSSPSGIENFDSNSFNETVKKFGNIKFLEFLTSDKMPAGYAEESTWELRDSKGKALRTFGIWRSEKSAGSDIYLKSSDKFFGGEIVKLEKQSSSWIPSNSESLLNVKKQANPAPAAEVKTENKEAHTDSHAH